jgi:predicted transcriptional regulator
VQFIVVCDQNTYFYIRMYMNAYQRDKMTTTVRLKEQTKEELDTFREYKNETYDEIIRKILYIAGNVKKNPQLSEKTLSEIEEARRRIREGNFYTEEEVRKMLGL